MAYQFSGPSQTKLLEVGESSLPRALGMLGAGTLTSGVTYLSYFIAEKSENINNVSLRTLSSVTSNVTVMRCGIYTVDFNVVPSGNYVSFYGFLPGDLHQIAATANDPSFLSAANTKYTKSFTTTWYKERGVTYAFALLGVVSTGTSLPSMLGQSIFNSPVVADVCATKPPIAECITGQADLYQKYTRNSHVLSAIGNTSSGSATVTVTAPTWSGQDASTYFRADDAGQPISGTNIPAGAYITAWNNFTSVTLSAAATGTGSSIAFTVGPSPFSVTTVPKISYAEFTP